MGLFSRKDKAHKSQPQKPSLTTVQSQVSIESNNSSIKSPAGTFSSRAMNRSSAGTNHTSAPNTPLTPFSPHIPKIDLPKPPDPDLDPAGYLRSLGAVRERCKIVTSKAVKNELNHFDVDMRKFPEVVSFVASIIRVRIMAWPLCFHSSFQEANSQAERLRRTLHQHPRSWPIPALLRGGPRPDRASAVDLGQLRQH